ncbi:MAG TPA: hypothetical protein VK738_06740 [Terriglobales bacterium]|nr:hypothetical protein [Terriglobales bacterium]
MTGFGTSGFSADGVLALVVASAADGAQATAAATTASAAKRVIRLTVLIDGVVDASDGFITASLGLLVEVQSTSQSRPR